MLHLFYSAPLLSYRDNQKFLNFESIIAKKNNFQTTVQNINEA